MGRTLPSITQVFLQEQESFTRFRRALRRSDQIALDDLFASAHQHLATAAYAAHALPFDAAGPPERLRQLWRYLESQPIPVHLERAERRDLFSPQPVTVLAVRVEGPAAQPALFHQVARGFPELAYYAAALPFTLHRAARHGTFPLARCRLATTDAGRVQDLQVLDSPWELDPPVPPLRLLSLDPHQN